MPRYCDTSEAVRPRVGAAGLPTGGGGERSITLDAGGARVLFLVRSPSTALPTGRAMSQLPVSAVGLDWIAAMAVLWVGGAAWTTAVASHLGLSEWKWFGLALLTGPLTWLVVYLRLRSARRRSRAEERARPPRPLASAGAPPPEA